MMRQLRDSLLCASPANLNPGGQPSPERMPAHARSSGAAQPLLPGSADAQASTSRHAVESEAGEAAAAPGSTAKKGSAMRFNLEMMLYVSGLHVDMAARKEVAKRIHDCFKHKSTTLDLDGLQVRHLPNVFQHLKHVRHFTHQGNSMSELPSSFKALTNLETMSLSREWTGFVDELDKRGRLKFPKNLTLPKLETLAFAEGIVNEIPEFIQRSPELKSLALINCGIYKRLPAFLARCEKLEKLDFSKSWFGDQDYASTPNDSPFWDIGKLPSVKILHMETSRACIVDDFAPRHFFDGIEQLENLEEFDFSNSSMETIPAQLSALKKLKKLCLDGNPLSNIRRAADLAPGCAVSMYGTRPWGLTNLMETMRAKDEGDGPTLEMTIAVTERAWVDGGCPGGNPPPVPAARKFGRRLGDIEIFPDQLLVLQPGKAPVVRDLS